MTVGHVTTAPEATELLSRLVAIPSVTPGIEDGTGEAAMADAVEALARECGAEVVLQEVAPGRSNVICSLPAGADTPHLVLEAHMDTVALGPMSDGHQPYVDGDGRLHGRGACDTKGSLAAMLLAFRWAAARDVRPAGLTLVASVDEETGSAGAKAFAAQGAAADGAVVGEPTSLDIVRVHRGGAFWRLETRGTAAHSSMPERGDNAIYSMVDFLSVLREEYERRLDGRAHPLAGPSTFSVGLIRAGSSFNMIPDRCEVVLDRRHIPGETGHEVDVELREILDLARDRFPDLQIDIGDPAVFADVLDVPATAPIVRALRGAADAVTGRARVGGAPYGSDAAILTAGGIPSVLCGPGDIAYAHSADEWVPVSEVVQAAQIYAETWLRFPVALRTPESSAP